MARYGQEFKNRAVARLLPPESASVDEVSREIGVSVSTLERWRSDALNQSGREQVWTAAAKFEAVLTTAAMDESQMVALVYHELRRIGPEGEILAPDVHDWWQLIQGLGRKWFYPDTSCPNLLDDDVNWKKLMGGLYDQRDLDSEN